MDVENGDGRGELRTPKGTLTMYGAMDLDL